MVSRLECPLQLDNYQEIDSTHLHFYAPKQKEADAPTLCPRLFPASLLRDLLLLALWRIKIFMGKMLSVPHTL